MERRKRSTHMLMLPYALMGTCLLSAVNACQPPTPSFRFASQPSYNSQPAYGSYPASNSYTPSASSYSHDSYSSHVESAPPPPAPLPAPIPPASQSYTQAGLEPFSGKISSGVQSGEGVYQGSPPAAYAKYGKSSKQFEPYPGYVPPPPGPEDVQYPQSGTATVGGHANSYKSQAPPLNMNGLQGMTLPGYQLPQQSYQAAHPQLVPQSPQYQMQPLPQPPTYQALPPFSSYVPPPAQVPAPSQGGQLFDGNHMVPHYQPASRDSGMISQGVHDCSTLRSITDLPRCVNNKPSISTNANSLICNFDDGSSCRFDASNLNIASIPTPTTQAAFAKLMGRPDAPEGNFAYQLIETPRGEEISIGTAISCQRGNGVLKMNYWLSDPTEIDFKVCTQDHIARSCTQPILYSSTSSVIVEVVHPNATVFDVEIVVANIMHPLLFAIDSIEYRADMCEDEKMPAPADKVNSFFEEDNAVDKDRPPRDDMEKKRGGSDENQTDRALNASPPILTEQFQVDPAEYDHEADLPAAVDAAYENSITEFEPTTPVPPAPHANNNNGPRDPFNGIRMRQSAGENLEKTSFPPAMEPLSMQAANTRRLRIRRLSACNLLDCTFDGDMCHYANYMNTTGSYGPWSLGNKPVGNVHTGIKNLKDGAGFLYVGADTMDAQPSEGSNLREYILESPSFIIPEDTPLSFDVYRRSNDITLKVCFDDLSTCPYEVPPLEKEVYWKEGETVMVPASVRKVYFIATQKKRFKWLAIDNIQLKSSRC